MGTTDSEGPAWNKFWLSLDNESESMVSGEGSRPPHTPSHDARSFMSHDMPSRFTPGGILDRGDSVLPNESASHHGADSPPGSAIGGAMVVSPGEAPFPFKFKAPSGRMHRLQIVANSGIAELISNVTAKLGAELDTVGGSPEVEDGKIGKSGFALSYLDNEGDTVSITTDRDLFEAITLARQGRRDKVDLFVHHPEQPPIPATDNPQPALPTPPESELRPRRKVEESEDDAEVTERPRRYGRQSSGYGKQEEQLIQGVPNELLLPGAIVTLAVVIVATFTISRATAR